MYIFSALQKLFFCMLIHILTVQVNIEQMFLFCCRQIFYSHRPMDSSLHTHVCPYPFSLSHIRKNTCVLYTCVFRPTYSTRYRIYTDTYYDIRMRTCDFVSQNRKLFNVYKFTFCGIMKLQQATHIKSSLKNIYYEHMQMGVYK